jgi:hypothetical protein
MGRIEEQMHADHDPDGVSLIRGGPFYHAQVVTRLIHPGQWNLARRVIFALAVGWLPLVILTALFDPKALGTLLLNYKVAARILIAVPVLLLGQVLMESRFRMIFGQVRKFLLAPSELTRMQLVLTKMIRLRDSVIPN